MRGVASSGLAGHIRRLHRFRCYESVKTRSVVCIVFSYMRLHRFLVWKLFSFAILYYPTVLRTLELFKIALKFLKYKVNW